jgi:two-component system response regulator YesN
MMNDRILKVGIADDESIVRMGLQTYIDWEANGFELAGLFSNGKEVMEYCEGNCLDILITDIKMPVMDGTDLIRAIREKLPGIAIIVLSNYDDFHLVSNSYKGGISEYILKQFVEPDNLLQALCSIRKEIRRRESAQPAASEAETQRGGKDELLRAMLMPQEGAGVPRGSAGVPSALNIVEGGLHCLVFKLYSSPGLQALTYEMANPLSNNIAVVLKNTAAKYCNMECCVLHFDTVAGIACFPGDLPGGSVAKKIADIAADASSAILSIFNLQIRTGCSGRHALISELPVALFEGREALKRYFFDPGRLLFQYDGEVARVFLDEKAMMRDALSALKLREYGNVNITVRQTFEILRAAGSASPTFVKQMVIRLIYEVDMFISDAANDQCTYTSGDEPLVQAIMECTNLEQIRELATGVLAGMLDFLQNSSGSASIVDEARKYVLKNYGDSIGLTEVSGHLGINASYLSRLFRQRTGEHLSHYISRIRIEKSIELMGTIGLSTDEIAEKVGFPNANYFIRVFKRITGKTITEFKISNPR